MCHKQHASLVRIGPVESDLAHEEVEAGLLPAISYSYQLEERSEERQQFTIWTPELTYTELAIPLAGQHQLENATAALAIEKMEHHPEWLNVYNRVTVDLTTYDAEGITQKDADLAKLLDETAKRLQ